MLSLTQTQWLLLTLFVSSVVGFQRGWERSLITSAIIVLVTWYLILGGDTWIFRTLTNWQALKTMPSTQVIHAVAAPLYGAFFVLAFMAGTYLGNAPKTGFQRWVGIVPGAVTGLAFLAYLNQWAAPALFSHTFRTYFPLFFAIGVAVNLLFLLVVAKSHSPSK